MLATVFVLFILSSSLCAEQVQVPSSEIHTINTIGTVELPCLRGDETCKATVTVDDWYKTQDDISCLKFTLVDNKGNKVSDLLFVTIARQFSIDIIDLDGDGEKDFVFFIREQFPSHVHKTMVIYRAVNNSSYHRKVLSVPYAGKTKDGINWNYKHSYFRQENGNIHIKLTLDKHSPSFPVKTRWINIADRSVPHVLKASKPSHPLPKGQLKDGIFIPNLLGKKGYTIQLEDPVLGGNRMVELYYTRTIKVIDENGKVIAQRHFKAFYIYDLNLFDIDADGDKEFIFVFHTGSGTGFMAFEMSIDKIVGGQFIPYITCPLAEAWDVTGDWSFTEWKYLGYEQEHPSEVAFEMVLNYSASDRHKELGVPDDFPRAEKMIMHFQKDTFSINLVYPESLENRPLRTEGKDWYMIFK
jgi:hypothetical protein